MEDRYQRRNDDPQLRLVHGRPPGRLIDIGVLRADVLLQFGHRLLQGVGGGPLQLGHRSRRDRQAEEVMGQLPNGTLPQGSHRPG